MYVTLKCLKYSHVLLNKKKEQGGVNPPYVMGHPSQVSQCPENETGHICGDAEVRTHTATCAAHLQHALHRDICI
jgi:hypothetical protein